MPSELRRPPARLVFDSWQVDRCLSAAGRIRNSESKIEMGKVIADMNMTLDTFGDHTVMLADHAYFSPFIYPKRSPESLPDSHQALSVWPGSFGHLSCRPFGHNSSQLP